MKCIFCLWASLCLCIAHAQTNNNIKPLSIGDTIPDDLVLTNVYNYPASEIRLSDLKGKLVILDFWSTWCGACIEAFPKMHELQKVFKDRVNIIFVNSYPGDSIAKVRDFLDNRKKTTGQQVWLPFSLQQYSLLDYFPHRFIPHYVWINKDGVVAAITSSTEVTGINIENLLQGTKNIHEKKDILNYDYKKPFFQQNHTLSPDGFLRSSVLSKYVEGLGSTSGMIKNDDGKVTRFYMFNYSPTALIRAAFYDNRNVAAGRIIMQSKNQAYFSEKAGQDQDRYANAYCYELTMPPASEEELFSSMKKDICSGFRVKVVNAKRKIKCLILSLDSNDQRLKTKGGQSMFSTAIYNKRKFISNQSVDEVAKYFEGTLKIPVINESKIKYNVDVNLPSNFDFKNLNEVVQSLTKAGFTVREEEREIEFAIIMDASL